MYVIGIDIGTTNVKVCLFQLPDFELVDLYRFSTPTKWDNNDSEFEMEKIWNGVKKGLHFLSNKIDNPSELKSISIASAAQSIVLLDEQDQIIEPTITWFDPRSKSEAELINNIVGQQSLYAITGIVSHSNHSLTKLLWIKNKFPERYAKLKKWTCLSGFLAFKLSGKYATDVSLASRTLLLDLSSQKWSTEMIEYFDLNTQTFPQLVESGASLSVISKTIASEIGLNPSINIAIAGHDHMAGSICTNLAVDNELLNSTGTTEGLLLLKNKPFLNSKFQEYAISNGLYVKDNLFSLYGSMPTAGHSLNWFTKNFLASFAELVELSNTIYQDYQKNSKELIKNLLLFIPHLRGSGPPYRDSSSRGLLYGLQDNTDNKSMLFAVLAGLCFELRTLKDAYTEFTDQTIRSMKVIGPATLNPLWLQLKADILNCEILSYKTDEAVARGAGILAAIKQGYIDKLPVNSYDRYLPSQENKNLFNEYYQQIYIPLSKIKREFDLIKFSDS
ncbi:FGGY family carbohydrate kinase [Niallia taxi]|uniref:FGGY-family carbohydrate kinase n=1 Tax=Niallia taxi TaxID=2499688 RepID=UPI00203E84FA|nr:FGGY family carbohydrate kinase [Niallia taxi]MCM3213236.1 FGGY family carbohydrate kinase [Niallia taxi]